MAVVKCGSFPLISDAGGDVVVVDVDVDVEEGGGRRRVFMSDWKGYCRIWFLCVRVWQWVSMDCCGGRSVWVE